MPLEMSLSSSILVGRMEEPRPDEPVFATGVDTGGEFRFIMDGGDADAVRKLLEQGASANTKADHDRHLPLHYALTKRREDMVEALLDHGAMPHARDENGRLPLLLASRLGLSDSVGMLLKSGARPFQPLNERSWSALHVAAHYGHLECVEVILEHCQELLNVRSSKDTADTPLHLASRGNHIEIVELLLSSGAEVNLTNQPLGHTPLHVAASMGNTEITEILLSYGADPNLKEKASTRRCPLEIARDHKHNDCITVLLDAMEVTVEDAKGTINSIERVRFKRSQRELRQLQGLYSRPSSRNTGFSRGTRSQGVYAGMNTWRSRYTSSRGSY